jgi:hypothetical protein
MVFCVSFDLKKCRMKGEMDRKWLAYHREWARANVSRVRHHRQKAKLARSDPREETAKMREKEYWELVSAYQGDRSLVCLPSLLKEGSTNN